MKIIKRAVVCCLLATIILLFHGECTYAAAKASVSVTNVSSGYVLPKGKSVSLKVKVKPASVKKKGVTYSSSNKKVATVSKKGKIKAKKAGTVYITVRTKGPVKAVQKVKLIVGKRVTSLAFSKKPKNAVMTAGESYKMKVSVKPSNASNKSLKWSSSNTKVLTVSSKGVVTAKAAGTATITAAAKDGSGKKVRLKLTVYKPVKSVKITSEYKYPYMRKGETMQLAATCSPGSALQGVTWESSDQTIAAVDGSGKVTAGRNGLATITATASDGTERMASYTVSVVSLNAVRVESIGHRGYSAIAPENSAASFMLAAKAHFDSVECDVFKTKDNVFVVSHDNSLERVYGVDRKITESYYEEIRDLPAVWANGTDTYPNETLLTIQDYMDIISASDKRMSIELKSVWSQTVTDQFYDLITSYGVNDRIDFVSFKNEALVRLVHSMETYEERHQESGAGVEDAVDEGGAKEDVSLTKADMSNAVSVKTVSSPARPGITFLMTDPTAVTVDGMDGIDWALTHGFDIASYYKNVTPDIIRQVHEGGQKMGVYTIDSFDVAYYYAAIMGADRVTSNTQLLD